MGKLNGQRYHFLYKSINLINNKYYYGVHSTYNLEDGYLGSGKRLTRAVKKYGKQNFKCEILEFFESREKLLQREKEIVNEQLLQDPLCMNLTYGGGGGATSEMIKIWGTAGRKAIREKLKNDKEFFKRYSEKSRKIVEKLREEGKFVCYDGFKNKKHSEETKRNIGKANSIKQKGKNNSQFGTCWIKKDKEIKKIKQSELEKHLKLGWLKGRK